MTDYNSGVITLTGGQEIGFVPEVMSAERLPDEELRVSIERSAAGHMRFKRALASLPEMLKGDTK